MPIPTGKRRGYLAVRLPGAHRLEQRELPQLGEIEIDGVVSPVAAMSIGEACRDVGYVVEIEVVQHDELARRGWR